MNTAKAVLVLSLFSRLVVGGENPKIPFCEAQVSRAIARWAPRPEWRVAAPEPRTVLYLSPTARLGQWLELRIEESGAIRLTRESDERVEMLHYRPGACAARLERHQTHYSAERMAHSFTDATLREIFRENHSGI